MVTIIVQTSEIVRSGFYGSPEAAGIQTGHAVYRLYSCFWWSDCQVNSYIEPLDIVSMPKHIYTTG